MKVRKTPCTPSCEELPGAIHLGTSTWSFPGWAGIVYDKPASESTLSKKGLAAYSHHPILRAACIDRGFYQPLSLAEYSAYACARVPDISASW